MIHDRVRRCRSIFVAMIVAGRRAARRSRLAVPVEVGGFGHTNRVRFHVVVWSADNSREFLLQP